MTGKFACSLCTGALERSLAIFVKCFDWPEWPVISGFESRIICMGLLTSLMRRRFFKDMQPNALDKKSNLDYLEKEIGMKRFLPKSVLDALKVNLSSSLYDSCDRFYYLS